MDLESVKRYLEKDEAGNGATVDSIPYKFFEPFIVQGITVDVVESGRVVCTMKVPDRLLLKEHRPIDATLMFVQEEIEIESKALRVGKAVAVVSVELRKKKTGKIVAHGRHTKYLAVSSKM
ncbi:hypothetical protein RJ639_011904 [Escallonia herrerae]|uniref:Uncharacterized protein n=1 Tax=Escallonia herrerae TaxID=1293975 RepID=A0AA88VKT7_9ASTE|nr:hypothetical protein RJ639_011904 [Escallonia herrerae]